MQPATVILRIMLAGALLPIVLTTLVTHSDCSCADHGLRAMSDADGHRRCGRNICKRQKNDPAMLDVASSGHCNTLNPTSVAMLAQAILAQGRALERRVEARQSENSPPGEASKGSSVSPPLPRK